MAISRSQTEETVANKKLASHLKALRKTPPPLIPPRITKSSSPMKKKKKKKPFLGGGPASKKNKLFKPLKVQAPTAKEIWKAVPDVKQS